ncbi:MAG: methionine ABC transporter permease [Tissierellia bacterium]|nr:methionine ABC transporter permease [Tissierellia bacterium]
MERIWEIVSPAIPETLYMVFFSAFLSLLLGLPLGIILTLTREKGLAENRTIYGILDWIINILRSFPFVILILVVFPLSRFIVGKSIGTTASIVPLTVAATPFVARLMEGYFLEVDRGVIEAAKAMGSTNGQIVWKVLIPEALPSIVGGITMTIINIIGYSAMAGILGGGGLGDVASRYGYQRNQLDILWASVLVIIVIVQIVQFIGNKWAKALNKK